MAHVSHTKVIVQSTPYTHFEILHPTQDLPPPNFSVPEILTASKLWYVADSADVSNRMRTNLAGDTAGHRLSGEKLPAGIGTASGREKRVLQSAAFTLPRHMQSEIE